jgi:hypothetical protein
MRRLLLLLVAVAMAAGVAGGTAPAKPGHTSLYGLVSANAGTWLSGLDPDTLEPLGTRLSLGTVGAFAYDSHGWLAYADGRRVRIVDVQRMRAFKSIPLWTGMPVAVGWLQWDTIVVVTGMSVLEVRAIDWATERVVRTARVNGTVVARARGDDELVLLLAPAGEIGPARLLVVEPTGKARVIPVPRISAGQQWDSSTDPPTGKGRQPGLALDAEHDVAYVVGDGLVAEVPLAGSAAYHSLRGSFAKVIAGKWVSAAWLGNGTLAIAGSVSADGRRIDATGLELVDTRTWTSKVVENGASWVEPSNGLALVTGTSWMDGEERRGIGVLGIDSNGNERFHVLAGEWASVVGVSATRAYLSRDGRRGAAVDLASGRVVAQFDRDVPVLLALR